MGAFEIAPIWSQPLHACDEAKKIAAFLHAYMEGSMIRMCLLHFKSFVPNVHYIPHIQNEKDKLHITFNSKIYKKRLFSFKILCKQWHLSVQKSSNNDPKLKLPAALNFKLN